MKELEKPTIDWEDLLDLIEDGQLVPILGKELLIVETPDGERHLEDLIVENLISSFKLSPDDFPERCSLNEFSVRYLRKFETHKRETSKRRIQKRVAEIMMTADLQIPEPLLKLAAITQQLGAGAMFLLPLVMLITRVPAAGLVMAIIGLASMGIATLVHLVTLPVEIDASFGKALPILQQGHYVEPGDEAAVRRVLRAAAFTYVAGSLASLLNLARWLAFLRRA